MKLSLATTSLLLFGLSLVLWLALTLTESALVGASSGTERLITFTALVIPAAIGCTLGIISLSRRDGRTGLAVAGAVLNGLFAIFHLLIILFAG